jgi:hypothetical protein
MKERKYKDGWEVLQTKDVLNGIKETISDGKEQDRVVDIMADLLSPMEEVSSFFYEVHCNDNDVDCDAITDEIETAQIFEGKHNYYDVYDSSHLWELPDSGYNCISLFYGPWNESRTSRDTYVVLSMNGDGGASALSEYFKFTIEYSTQS